MGYRTVDWRGKVPGSPSSYDLGAQKKTKGVVWHWSGPATGVAAGTATLYETVVNEIRYQMAPGRFDPGYTVTGYQYHYVVWEDAVYVIRNPDARLWHCADGTRADSWNYAAYSVHVPVGEGQKVSERTLQTLREFTDDLLEGMGRSRSYAKGHKEISATSCPGPQLMAFLGAYRNSTPTPSQLFRVKVGGQQAAAFREQGKATELVRKITALKCKASVVSADGWHRVRVPAHQIGAYSTSIRANALVSDLDELGVKATVEGGEVKPVNNTEKAIAYAKQLIGAPYSWWRSGDFGGVEGAPAWAKNAAAPDAARVRREGLFCAAVLNLSRRAIGKPIPPHPSYSGYDGGVAAWWFVFYDVSEWFVRGKWYPNGTVIIRKYRDEVDQGHIGIVVDGYVLQSYPFSSSDYPDCNMAWTIAESDAGYYYEIAVPPSGVWGGKSPV